MHRTTRAAALLAAAAALTLGLAACSASTDEPAGTSAAAAADVAFAQSMIPHHEQAVAMAEMALDPASGASPQVRALAEQIQAAQGPEIQQMTGWLQQWGAPTAMPGAISTDAMAEMDHGGHDMGGLTMSGMMSGEEMAALAEATGATFDRMWLQMMVEHHEGALTMAEQVTAATADPEVAALASSIVEGQTAEIATMQELLP